MNVKQHADSVDDALGELQRHWLIAAKLEAPRQQVLLIERPRLLDQLALVLQSRLGIIIAPAGFGKTTLLSQWWEVLADRGVQRAWLTLDETDADLHQFLSYVVFALSKAGVAIERMEKLAEQGLVEMSAQGVLAGIFEALSHSEQQVVLILDDYHRLQSSEVDAVLEHMVASGPGTLTIVISSRLRPRFHLPSLMASGQAVEFGAESLRLSLQETQAAVGMSISAQMARALFERTEGWPVAVQLARLLVDEKQQPEDFLSQFTGHTGHIATYLADQVIEQLAEDVQDFLIRTSILERFNVALANAVCEIDNGLDILRQLEPLSALLVPIDQQHEWYRYHHLFADCLQDLLARRYPTQVAKLHIRASIWFEQKGQFNEAARHAYRGDDLQRVADIIEDAGGWELILFSGIGYLRNLLGRVPETELHRFPRLQLARAYLSMKEGEIRVARAYFDAAVANPLSENHSAELQRDLLSVGVLLDLYEDQPLTTHDVTRIRTLKSKIAGDDALTMAILLAAESLGLIGLARFSEAETALQSMVRAMRQANSVLGLSYCNLHAGVVALYAGRLQLAEAILVENHQLAEDNFGADSGPKYLADLLLVVLKHWQGCLSPEDEPQFLAGLQYMEHYDGWYEVFANGYEVMLDINLSTGDYEQARTTIARLKQVTAERAGDRLPMLLAALSLRLAVAEENDELAAAYVFELEKDFDAVTWRKAEYCWHPQMLATIALSRFYLSRDRGRTLVLLSQGIEACKRLGVNIYLVQLLVDRARFFERYGQHPQAVADFLKALEIASTQNIRRPFVGHPSPKRLLRAAQRCAREAGCDAIVRAFISECINAALGSGLGVAGDSGVSLSPREQEVLQELAQGLSNKEIARMLDMTDHTVKFHLKNIFSKLNVDRRTKAVARARDLKLVS